MDVQTLDPELLESLQKASVEVLETMAFLPSSYVAELPESSLFVDEMIGVLGFTGTKAGSFCVRASLKVATTIAAKMLMLEPAELTDFPSIADAFGEVVNMIGGNFKNAWVARGNRMDLSVPHVVHNGNVRINSDREGAVRCCIRVDLEPGTLLVAVHFEP